MKNKGIQITPIDKKELTKAQKQFNRLSKQVQNLNKKLVNEHDIYEETLRIYTNELSPIEEQDVLLKQDVLLILDKALGKYKFGVRQKQNTETVILHFINEVVDSNTTPTAEVQEVINKYSDVTYEEMVERGNTESREMIIQMAKDIMGIEIDEEKIKDLKINSFEDVLMFLKEHHEDEINANIHEAHQSKFADEPTGSNKKKTAKQLENEKREEEKEQFKKKNIRSIYISLAKMLHPDTALTEEDRMEKEQLMKEVTAAYDTNDFARLISLEAKWIHKTEEHLAQINENVLLLYCEVLKDQIDDLKEEVEFQKMNPRYMSIHHLEPFRSPTKSAIKYLLMDVSMMQMRLRAKQDSLTTLNSKAEILSLVDAVYTELTSFHHMSVMDDMLDMFM